MRLPALHLYLRLYYLDEYNIAVSPSVVLYPTMHPLNNAPHYTMVLKTENDDRGTELATSNPGQQPLYQQVLATAELSHIDGATVNPHDLHKSQIPANMYRTRQAPLANTQDIKSLSTPPPVSGFEKAGPQTATSPPSSPHLPSLLRFVDNYLMRNSSQHDRPPDVSMHCPICHFTHFAAPIRTTFLSLVPCGCWVHYRCFVWHAAHSERANDCCPVCATRLFFWEPIAAVTLAMRTGLGFEPDCAGMLEYAEESAAIEGEIARAMGAGGGADGDQWVAADGSLDLRRVYGEVCARLEEQGRPHAAWLQWRTTTGWLLWRMLVAIKMRRWVVERMGRVVGTEGWREFERGREELQGRIMALVRE